jgi:hypothetical protein
LPETSEESGVTSLTTSSPSVGRGVRPACRSSFWDRYFFSEPSGSCQGPKYTSRPRIFLAPRLVA